MLGFGISGLIEQGVLHWDSGLEAQLCETALPRLSLQGAGIWVLVRRLLGAGNDDKDDVNEPWLLRWKGEPGPCILHDNCPRENAETLYPKS